MQSDTIQLYSWFVKGVHIFPKRIIQIVNVKAQLEFKLTYYDVAVQHVSPYAMGTSCNNNKDLLTVIQESWNHFNKEYCLKLLKFMPQRIKAVIKARRELIKYFFCQWIPYFFFDIWLFHNIFLWMTWKIP